MISGQRLTDFLSNVRNPRSAVNWMIRDYVSNNRDNKIPLDELLGNMIMSEVQSNMYDFKALCDVTNGYSVNMGYYVEYYQVTQSKSPVINYKVLDIKTLMDAGCDKDDVDIQVATI